MKLSMQAKPVCAAGRPPERPAAGEHANEDFSADQAYTLTVYVPKKQMAENTQTAENTWAVMPAHRDLAEVAAIVVVAGNGLQGRCAQHVAHDPELGVKLVGKDG